MHNYPEDKTQIALPYANQVWFYRNLNWVSLAADYQREAQRPGRQDADRAAGCKLHFSDYLTLYATPSNGSFTALQIINAVLKDPEDKTQISLLYANQTPDDILLRKQLDELAAKHDNFRVWHTGAPQMTHVRTALCVAKSPCMRSGCRAVSGRHMATVASELHMSKRGADVKHTPHLHVEAEGGHGLAVQHKLRH